MTPYGRGGAIAALVAVVVLATATVREVAVGRAEVAAADGAAAKGQWKDAVAHARAAAEARLPGSPWPDRGLDRLESLGHDAEVRGDDAVAILAYGALRTAVLSTRSGVGADGASFDAARDGLLRVASGQRQQTLPPEVLDRIRHDRPPATWPLLVLGACILAMLAGLARLAWPGPGARVAVAAVALGFAGYSLVMLTS